eukprot:TRINITY_DN3182_c0_g1_i4.p1 TRINITY_DN3182_c0_g1~~TRINITY_DN3182_c0_g1_i4.p1  ORF type:complete len:523 (+),score=44.05 TRINITY_DN3182_c0_g1_i4:787-2355(+)
MADELVKMLVLEEKCPGNAFRFKLRDEIPLIDVLAAERVIQEQKAKWNMNSIGQAWCLSDENQQSYFEQLLYQNQLKLESKLSNPTLYNLRALIVISLMNQYSLSSPELLKHIVGISDENMFSLYCKLSQIVERCNELESVNDILKIVSKVIEEIEKNIMEMPSRAQFLNIFEQINYPVPYPVFPTFQLFTLQNIWQKKNKGIQISTPQTSTTPYIPVNHSTLVLCDQLQKIISSTQSIYTGCGLTLSLNNFRLKLIVFGGDQTLQTLCQCLCQLFSDNNEILQNVDLRIYVIPAGKEENHLAKWIASKDVWYARQVYNPFKSPPLFPIQPYSNNQSNNATQSDKTTLQTQQGQLSPSMRSSRQPTDYNFSTTHTSDKKILRLEMEEELIQSYLRDGQRIVSVETFEIRCFKNKQAQAVFATLNSDIDEVVYFCVGMEMGFGVDLRNDNDALDDDIIYKTYEKNEKGKIHFTGIELEINVQFMDLQAKPGEEETVICQVHSLKINNIQKPYFEGNLPIPNSK